MLISSFVEPVDYLVIGHLTQDLIPDGSRLGGTAAFAALTAQALGLRVGIVTSTGPEATLDALQGIQISNVYSEHSSTFSNIYTPQGRIQYIYHSAANLAFQNVPEAWRSTPIVHLGPIAQEVEPNMVYSFPESLIGLTPQGWLRSWDKEGRVHPTEWPEANFVLSHSAAAVLSIEDVQGEEARIEEMVSSARILVVTEGSAGARLYWNGDLRRFRAPKVVEVDPVGAGDIFAASFFVRLHSTKDPWEAARFATYLAANSVTRPGLQGVPTPEEVQNYTIEII